MIAIRQCLSLFVLLTGAFGIVQADYFPQPFQQVAVSANYQYLARVDLGKRIPDEKRREPDILTIHRYDPESHQYVKISEFPYGDHPGSGFLFISNDGKYVVGINVGHWIGREKLGIRLYNSEGELLKFWHLAAFMTEEEILKTPRTGATTQWFSSGRFDYGSERFDFYGPGVGIRGRKEDWNFAFSIDLATLGLSRR